jgi:prepilin-type N-terminal cleavage/methylation domain-containing protein
MRIQTTKPGFTLIELLVVVLLIAILVTIIIGVSGAVIARGKAETTRKNMQLVMLAIDTFAETDTSKTWPAERTIFPTMNGATGTRDAAFLPSNTDSGNDWMAFLRAKYLSWQLLGGTETVAGNTVQSVGNAAAKAKVGNAPTTVFPFSDKSLVFNISSAKYAAP